jgi:hypothetical protein
MTSRTMEASRRVSPLKMESHRISLTGAPSSHLFMARAFTVELDKVPMIIPLKSLKVTWVKAMLAMAETK